MAVTATTERQVEALIARCATPDDSTALFGSGSGRHLARRHQPRRRPRARWTSRGKGDDLRAESTSTRRL